MLATTWYNIHVQQEGHRDLTLHPHVGYKMVQYTCATRGPQRLDTASTCWLQHGTIYMYNKRATETRHCIHMLATTWYNIHVQQEGHRDLTLHPHVGYKMVQYTCATRGPQRLDTASTCWLQHGIIYMYNKRATETRHWIHMLATTWYNTHVQQEGHRD